MWVTCNTVLRERLPGLHRLLKRTFAPRLRSGLGVPVPKRLGRERFLLHSRYLTQDLDAFEPHVRGWLTTALRKGDTFIDVGSFHGLHTVLAARLVPPSGRVVAFEPSSANLSVLRYHLRVNRLSNVTVVASVVGDRATGRVPFFLIDDGDSTSNSATFGSLGDKSPPPGKSLTEVRLPTESLDTYCRRTATIPSVIKIDVEGAELAVLRGARELLQRCRPIVIVGIHPFWMPKGDSPEKLVGLLQESSYDMFDIKGEAVDMLAFGDYLMVPYEYDLSAFKGYGTATADASSGKNRSDSSYRRAD